MSAVQSSQLISWVQNVWTWEWDD